MAIPDLLARKLDTLSDRPGVYLWKDAAGQILYVGKAKSLRARVPAYFPAEVQETPERAALARQIADLETIVVPSEAQALLLENNLIKEHKPRFNIRLTDDKSYPRIAVTLGEPFPRVLVVRRVNLPGARYFGPYTDVSTLRQTLTIIRRLFTVRSCHYALPDDHPDRPCLDYHIERCRAPCVGFQNREDYGRMIDDVLIFLEGKTADVRARLRDRMIEASTRTDYERAAQLRDALEWLDQLEQPQAVELVGGGDADAIGFARDGDEACGVVLRVRGGRVIARDHRFFEHVEHESEGAGQQDDFAAVHEVVTRFLRRRLEEQQPLPDLMVVDGGKGQLGAALEAARRVGCDQLPIVSLAKREEEVFLPGRPDGLRLSRRSPGLKLLQRVRDEAHRFAVSYSRGRRARRTLTSELLTIPGIGPNRRRALLERFGSLAGVRTASAPEIAALPGFSTRLAERILETLKPRA